jgi:hypothetical protein
MGTLSKVRFPYPLFRLSMKNSVSLWFPNLQSWISAVVLAFTSGLLIAGMNNVANATRIFDRMPPHLDLFVGTVALLSPIAMIAFGHHWVNLSLERVFPSSRASDADVVNGYWPTLPSWWEGLYGEIVIMMATILCFGIGGLLMPFHTDATGPKGAYQVVYQISMMLADVNKLKYLFSPPFIVWIFSAAYLYQFEFVMRLHFASTVKR